MFCTKCGVQIDADSKFCNTCGEATPDTQAPPSTGADKHNLPAAWLILLSGIGDIIVGGVFIIMGLILIGDIGMEFSSFIWVLFGGIIAGTGVNNIIRRNNFEKINEIRTAMITGVVILGIATGYFIVSGSLSWFFILIIIPDIIGMIGAQKNYNYAKSIR